MSHSKKIYTKDSGGKVIKEVKSYGNDPFFIKKALRSEEVLKKVGFPKFPEKTT